MYNKIDRTFRFYVFSRFNCLALMLLRGELRTLLLCDISLLLKEKVNDNDCIEKEVRLAQDTPRHKERNENFFNLTKK